jgi:hypothetical protein
MISKLRKISGVASVGIAILLTMSTMPAFGADRIRANIQFPFQVGTKTLPAGVYEFAIDREHFSVEVLSEPRAKGSSAMAAILTTIAETPHSNTTHAHVVFDKVGDTYTLSEVWEPQFDGVLVYAMKGQHQHHVVHANQ